MIPSKNQRLTASIAAALLTCSTSLLAQGLNVPQDTNNAIVKRFPAGTQDFNGRPITLRRSDYELTSPKTGAKVYAGIRFDLHPETKSNFDFIKIFVHTGRVWAVWRDDSSGRYDYDKMLADILAKYTGASPQKTSFMLVNGNTISGEPGRRRSKVWNSTRDAASGCRSAALLAATA
jgi:hypothetical protein